MIRSASHFYLACSWIVFMVMPHAWHSFVRYKSTVSLVTMMRCLHYLSVTKILLSGYHLPHKHTMRRWLDIYTSCSCNWKSTLSTAQPLVTLMCNMTTGCMQMSTKMIRRILTADRYEVGSLYEKGMWIFLVPENCLSFAFK